MRGKAIIVGTGLMLAAVSAGAQPRQPMLAAVDALGRVVPVQPTAPAPDTVGTADRVCPNAHPLSVAEAKALVGRIASEEHFFPDFVASVAKIESGFVSTRQSEKGAYGLMQLMPDTAERFAVDLCDPAGNVRGGVRLLRLLHDRYKNPFFILAAYNAGEAAVLKSRGVPPYPETVRFVADVIDDFYTWPGPQPAGPSSSPERTVAVASGVTEFAIPAPLSATSPSRQDEPSVAQWRDGFVLHVD